MHMGTINSYLYTIKVPIQNKVPENDAIIFDYQIQEFSMKVK